MTKNRITNEVIWNELKNMKERFEENYRENKFDHSEILKKQNYTNGCIGRHEEELKQIKENQKIHRDDHKEKEKKEEDNKKEDKRNVIATIAVISGITGTIIGIILAVIQHFF